MRVSSLEEVRAIALGVAGASDRAAPELVLEEYLQDRPEAAGHHFADYVSVESVVSDGRVSHLAITGRFPPAEPFRETGFFIPCAFDEDECAAIAELATAAVRALGVEVGSLHTEVKLTPQGPRVIELNGRIGGGVPEMLADATGIELLPLAMRVALGESIAFDEDAAVLADRLSAVRPGAPVGLHDPCRGRARAAPCAARRGAGHAEPRTRQRCRLARG